jgi:hypothetical protein
MSISKSFSDEAARNLRELISSPITFQNQFNIHKKKIGVAFSLQPKSPIMKMIST